MLKKGIKVLYVSNDEGFLGGSERSLFEIITFLDRSRVKPYFASRHYGELARSIVKLGVPFIKLNEYKMLNPFPFLFSNIKLISFIRNNQIDIIHNNRCIFTPYSWIPGKLTGTPIIIHHRDSKYYRPDRFFINHVNCNISISSWQNKEFLNNRGVLIHNGIVMNKFNHSSIIKMPKKEILTVGLVGRIAPIKGQDVFIKAAKIILHKKRNVHFLIIGDDKNSNYPDYLAHIKELIIYNHLENDVEFYGDINKIEQIYKNIDISVVPSIREPFGRVIVESMASYKPVIATNVGGATDIVTDKTGILIPVNDPNALADAILFLVDNSRIRVNMGIAGRERVEKFFTIENTLSKIYALYEKILCNREENNYRQI